MGYNHIFNQLESKKRTHNYGIKIPIIVYHGYEIDKNNKDTLWKDAIREEMHNVEISFDILYRDYHMSVGWKKVTGHMIFGVNMDFMRKERRIIDGPINMDP